VKGFASPGKLGESNDRWLDVLTDSARSWSSWEQALRIDLKLMEIPSILQTVRWAVTASYPVEGFHELTKRDNW